MDPAIEFSYGGKHYTVSTEAVERCRIVLPDKRVLQVQSWSGDDPPKPLFVHEITHDYASLTIEQIAEQLNAAVAEDA